MGRGAKDFDHLKPPLVWVFQIKIDILPGACIPSKSGSPWLLSSIAPAVSEIYVLEVKLPCNPVVPVCSVGQLVAGAQLGGGRWGIRATSCISHLG